MIFNFFKYLVCLGFLFLFLGSSTVSAMTIKEEIELGKEFLKSVKSQIVLVDDSAIVEYVSRIGNRIVDTLPEKYFDYHFYVVKEDVYNAFAGPGGHVFINSGLIAAMDNEAELAGVLGHEITHVSCRHISERIESSKKIGLATLAGAIAGVLLGAGTPVGTAVSISSIAAGQTLMLAYSREDEQEADQIGIKYLVKAGYGGQGLLTSLKKIRAKNWVDTTQIPHYMLTHPAGEERMAYIDNWLNKHPEDALPARANDPYEFEKFHARLVALFGDESSIEIFKAKIEKNSKNPSAYYGYGLMLFRAGKRSEAISELQRALQYRSLDSDILRDVGKIYFYDGKYFDALETLQNALEINPDDPEARFLLGQTFIELGRFQKAITTLENLSLKRPEYPNINYQLGQAYGKAGLLADAHYHLGLFYRDKKDLKNADFHFNRALKKSENPEQKSKIEKILKEMKQDEKERGEEPPR